MRMTYLKAILKRAVQGATVLLLGAGVASAQVNLTAARGTTTLPDGSNVPMWGYFCGTATGATCTSLNPTLVATPSATAWSPVVITVPYTGTSTSLTISLTNGLPVPTSLMIVGQVGGGLGSVRTTTPSPDHSNLSSNTVTWPTAG